MMFAVTVTFHINPERIETFMPLAIKNARASCEVEPGCQQFDVCRDGTEVFLYEIYDDRAAFDAHLASAHFRNFDASVADMIESKDVRLFSEVTR